MVRHTENVDNAVKNTARSYSTSVIFVAFFASQIKMSDEDKRRVFHEPVEKHLCAMVQCCTAQDETPQKGSSFQASI